MSLHGIGDFSRMSGLPVKTLRFYHEKGLLTPAEVDEETGYRRYDARDLDTARVIVALRRLDFGLETIAEILAGRSDDADILDFLEQKKRQVREEIAERRDVARLLDSIIEKERSARAIMSEGQDRIEETTTEPLLVGGIRMRGRYGDCGKGFKQLFRKLGRHVSGQPMLLCHDEEYRDEDADFEPCVPLKRSVAADGVDVRELEAVRCLTVLHRGPYEELSRSYGRLFEEAEARGLKLVGPSREIYVKGPGMIFKGNPKRYLTRIQFPIGT